MTPLLNPNWNIPKMAAKMVTAKSIGTPDDPAMFVGLVSISVCLQNKQTQQNLNKYLLCTSCLAHWWCCAALLWRQKQKFNEESKSVKIKNVTWRISKRSSHGRYQITVPDNLSTREMSKHLKNNKEISGYGFFTASKPRIWRKKVSF